MKTPFYNPVLTSLFAKLRVTPPYIASFDSGAAMLRATAAYLRGQDFPGIGIAPPAIERSVSERGRQLRSAIATSSNLAPWRAQLQRNAFMAASG